MKVSSKKTSKITPNHSSDIDYEDFMKRYIYYTEEVYSFFSA